jgi:hypothetical protein
MSRADIQIFTATQFAQGWQTWYKPKGITQSYMVALSGGGGGAAGTTGGAGTARAGGAGGQCSPIVRLITPSFFLPDVLYVQVGQGGLGGLTSAANGSPGTNSYISLGHSTATPNVLLASATAAPGGGTGITAGTLPTTIATTTTQQLGHWAIFVPTVAAGAGGAAAGAVGGSVVAWANHPLTAGAGGAGSTSANFTGGSVTATAAVDWGYRSFSAAGAIAAGGTTGTAVNGDNGLVSWQPFFMTGGAGGGAQNAGVGGNGGNGGIGCGGGGGGAGTTFGRGGNGGDGLVMIISW